jgi:hypothetical protein
MWTRIAAGTHVTYVRLIHQGGDNRRQRVSSGRTVDGSRHWVSREFVGIYGARDPAGSKMQLTTDAHKYWKFVAVGNRYLCSDLRQLTKHWAWFSHAYKHVKLTWLSHGSRPRHSTTPALCCHRRSSQGCFSALKRDSPLTIRNSLPHPHWLCSSKRDI